MGVKGGEGVESLDEGRRGTVDGNEMVAIPGFLRAGRSGEMTVPGKLTEGVVFECKRGGPVFVVRSTPTKQEGGVMCVGGKAQM